MEVPLPDAGCRSRLLDYDVMAGLHLWPVQPSDPSPFEVAAAGELQRRVEQALSTLPGTYREALLLVTVEGLSPAEAAGICGVNPVAMRQRLSRARAMLARRLDGSCGSPSTVLKEVLP